MKFNKISYTLFVFVMLMFFPSLINAWTKNDPPIEPPTTIKHDCAHWIEYNGFKLNDYNFNRRKAMTRDITLDKQASTWAAAYAFKIGGLEDMYKILPQEFCNRFDSEETVPMKFMALEKEKKICQDWIKLYGFRNSIVDNYNVGYVLNIDPLQVKYISIWAYIYYIYLSLCEKDDRLKPVDLCGKMGSHGYYANPKPFACKYEWLEQYDYMVYKNPYYVYLLAEYQKKEKSYYQYISIHYFPSTYGKELLELKESDQPVSDFTQMEFCKKYDGENDEPQKYPFGYTGEV